MRPWYVVNWQVIASLVLALVAFGYFIYILFAQSLSIKDILVGGLAFLAVYNYFEWRETVRNGQP